MGDEHWRPPRRGDITPLPSTNAATPAPSLWRDRDFNIYWLGQTLAGLGDAFAAIALPLLVLQSTGSLHRMGRLTALVSVANVVVGLASGALVDRVDRRRLMIACDLGRWLVYSAVPIVWWGDRPRAKDGVSLRPRALLSRSSLSPASPAEEITASRHDVAAPMHARPRSSRSSTATRPETLAATARASRPVVTPRGPLGRGSCGSCCRPILCGPSGCDTRGSLAGIARSPVAG